MVEVITVVTSSVDNPEVNIVAMVSVTTLPEVANTTALVLADIPLPVCVVFMLLELLEVIKLKTTAFGRELSGVIAVKSESPSRKVA